MTLEECLVVTAYTKILMVKPFSVFHGFAEKRVGHPIWTHEFALDSTWKELKAAVEKDFFALCKEVKEEP